MFPLVAPAMSSGLPPAGILWFDSSVAFLILSLAVAFGALTVFCAGLLARRERRPAGYSPPLPPRPGKPVLEEQRGRFVPANAS
jgi:hypothetical protein